MTEQAGLEFDAIRVVHDALVALDEDARKRVLTYIASLLGINAKLTRDRDSGSARGGGVDDSEEEHAAEVGGEVAKQAESFSNFAELYAAAGPKSNGEMALVAGYWLQVCQAADSFTAAAANKALTHLGHKVVNITAAIDSMKDQKPMLILQLKKSGASRQARKLYKVSHEGVKRVEAMLNG